MSEFIANLNAIPSAQDMASQNQDNFNLDEDLAMFTNTQFFDFDLGQDADLQPTNFDFNGQQRRGAPNAASNSAVKGMDFIAGRFWSIASYVSMFISAAAAPWRDGFACFSKGSYSGNPSLRDGPYRRSTNGWLLQNLCRAQTTSRQT